MDKTFKILNNLSNEDIIEIVQISCLTEIPEDHIIRKVASEIFNCNVDETTRMQFELIWMNLSTILADRLEDAMYFIDGVYRSYNAHKKGFKR